MALNLSKCHYFALSFNISAVYIALGLLISLQPPFYPSEAEKMGATPAEYGFVFGIANLSLFLFSPLFGKYGPKIGTKLCFNFGAVLQVNFVVCTFFTRHFFSFWWQKRNLAWVESLPIWAVFLRFIDGGGPICHGIRFEREVYYSWTLKFYFAKKWNHNSIIQKHNRWLRISKQVVIIFGFFS